MEIISKNKTMIVSLKLIAIIAYFSKCNEKIQKYSRFSANFRQRIKLIYRYLLNSKEEYYISRYTYQGNTVI